ncbi:hypothetical protein B0H17DRAFT_1135776 [Mycena rosella]|uniref:Uncharacterized protein n=1 Tax=Mycena rosella TaxID=1033263 RepID=A0AAD7GCH9_MYCRO|nr:hypothetical protein B0H17DRAFT_1135776 [Mycena rosella]
MKRILIGEKKGYIQPGESMSQFGLGLGVGLAGSSWNFPTGENDACKADSYILYETLAPDLSPLKSQILVGLFPPLRFGRAQAPAERPPTSQRPQQRTLHFYVDDHKPQYCHLNPPQQYPRGSPTLALPFDQGQLILWQSPRLTILFPPHLCRRPQTLLCRSCTSAGPIPPPSDAPQRPPGLLRFGADFLLATGLLVTSILCYPHHAENLGSSTSRATVKQATLTSVAYFNAAEPGQLSQSLSLMHPMLEALHTLVQMLPLQPRLPRRTPLPPCAPVVRHGPHPICEPHGFLTVPASAGAAGSTQTPTSGIRDTRDLLLNSRTSIHGVCFTGIPRDIEARRAGLPQMREEIFMPMLFWLCAQSLALKLKISGGGTPVLVAAVDTLGKYGAARGGGRQTQRNIRTRQHAHVGVHPECARHAANSACTTVFLARARHRRQLFLMHEWAASAFRREEKGDICSGSCNSVPQQRLSECAGARDMCVDLGVESGRRWALEAGGIRPRGDEESGLRGEWDGRERALLRPKPPCPPKLRQKSKSSRLSPPKNCPLALRKRTRWRAASSRSSTLRSHLKACTSRRAAPTLCLAIAQEKPSLEQLR